MFVGAWTIDVSLYVSLLCSCIILHKGKYLKTDHLYLSKTFLKMTQGDRWLGTGFMVRSMDARILFTATLHFLSYTKNVFINCIVPGRAFFLDYPSIYLRFESNYDD